MKARLVQVAVTVAATLALIVGLSGVAHASSYGTARFGPTATVNGVRVSSGVYHVWVSGSGRYVNYVKAMPQFVAPVGNICNWNITAEFFENKNGNNVWYKTVQGNVNSGCYSYARQASANQLNIRQTMRNGMVCSTLKANGVRQTSSCQSIF